jgi:DHA2 family multidrug resistance protein
MRNLGGAIGIAACATVLNDRTNLHFLRLAEHLNAANETLNDWLVPALAASDEGGSQVLREVWNLAYREAQTMTYADAFLMLMVGFAASVFLVPLMRKITPPAAPSAEAH